MIDYLDKLTAPALNHLADNLHAALELVSDVSAASLGQHVHQGKAGSKLLADDEHRVARSPAEKFKARYQGCRTDNHRREAIRDAAAELRAIRYSRKPDVDCQTLEGRLTVGRDTRPAHVVAHSYSYSIKHVYNLRKLAIAHDQRYGKKAA